MAQIVILIRTLPLVVVMADMVIVLVIMAAVAAEDPTVQQDLVLLDKDTQDVVGQNPDIIQPWQPVVAVVPMANLLLGIQCHHQVARRSWTEDRVRPAQSMVLLTLEEELAGIT
jgi:hypothetical protein